MEITPDDIHAASRLMSYFEGTARKAFHHLGRSDEATKNAFELSSLLKKKRGDWTATADEWRQALPSAPDNTQATSHLLEKICRSSPRLTFERKYRGNERVIKISLLEKPVGPVGEDFPPAEKPPANPTLNEKPSANGTGGWYKGVF